MYDLIIAEKYIKKAESARLAQTEFSLSFVSFKNLMSAKKCGYTNVELTAPRSGGKHVLATERTIDRIDNSIGYVSGNVIAVCHAANKLKAILENPNNPMTIKTTTRMLKKVNTHTTIN